MPVKQKQKLQDAVLLLHAFDDEGDYKSHKKCIQSEFYGISFEI